MMINVKIVLPFLALASADQESLKRKMRDNLQAVGENAFGREMDSLFHEDDRALSGASYSMSIVYRKRHQRRNLARRDPYATMEDEEMNLFADEGRNLSGHLSMSMEQNDYDKGHKKGHKHERNLAVTENAAAVKDPYAFFESDENEANPSLEHGRNLSELLGASVELKDGNKNAAGIRAKDPYAFFESDEDGEKALFGEEAGRGLGDGYSMSMDHYRRDLKTDGAPIGFEDSLFEEDYRALGASDSYSMPMKSSKKEEDKCGMTCRSDHHCDHSCPVCHKESKHDKHGKCVKESVKSKSMPMKSSKKEEDKCGKTCRSDHHCDHSCPVCHKESKHDKHGKCVKESVKSKSMPAKSSKKDDDQCNKRCKHDHQCGGECATCHKESKHDRHGTCVAEGGLESDCHCKGKKKYCHVCRLNRHGSKVCSYKRQGFCEDDSVKSVKKSYGKKKYHGKKKNHGKKGNKGKKGKDNKWNGW